MFYDMEKRLRERIPHSNEGVDIIRTFDGRLVGQTSETPFIDVPSGAIDALTVKAMIENFHDVYQERTGNRFAHIGVQGVTYRVAATLQSEKVEYPKLPSRDASSLPTYRNIALQYYGDQGSILAREYRREELLHGDRIEGPAIVREKLSTTFITPGQIAIVGEYGELRIRRAT
jgi:N-methylhydantoinase A